MGRRNVYRASSNEAAKSDRSSTNKTGAGNSKLVFRRNAAPVDQKPLCDIAKECGSCRFVNLNYQINLKKKHAHGVQVLKLNEVLGGAKVRNPVGSPRVRDYRAQAKLAVRAAQKPTKKPESDRVEKRFSLGLFRPGTHDVVELNRCPLHTASIRACLYDLQKILDSSGLTPWDEKAGTGDLRYLSIRATRHTKELMITFVAPSMEKRAEFRNIVDQLRDLEHRIVSAHININETDGNAIFGAKTKRVAGHERIREHIMDLSFEISPASFFQINPWQAERLYRRVEQLAGTPVFEAKAVDLYCGSGPISMMLARNGYEVLGVEENPQAIVDAKRNLLHNELEGKVTFITSRVEDAELQVIDFMEDTNLFVVNPSRRGLAPEARQYIGELLKEHTAPFIYVSCDIHSLARDLKALKEIGGYELRQLEAFDMFPQTDKMEWIAVLTSNNLSDI